MEGFHEIGNPEVLSGWIRPLGLMFNAPDQRFTGFQCQGLPLAAVDVSLARKSPTQWPQCCSLKKMDGGLKADRVFSLMYISVSAVTATYGSALTAGHLEKPQVTKGFCPAIRCLA
ncbi:hypothetical protein [Pseudomonas fluorescens]|uniref:hypothetical protein n=1 Tax=Pseudomonas fluorescens TaxID=294 RepID=UPI00123F0EB2|nr:hypothetical protein [Pseudomonas fluorescens]